MTHRVTFDLGHTPIPKVEERILSTAYSKLDAEAMVIQVGQRERGREKER